MNSQGNKDARVVRDFGLEWSRFDQGEELDPKERQTLFDDYFAVFPWEALPADAHGADIGCGSGRWAQLVAPRVGILSLVDPSEAALAVAERNLREFPNTRFYCTGVDALPFQKNELDFAYSLGVLHHVPDTLAAIRSIAEILKPGAPFLIYLYYALDNRPGWFKALWFATDLVRRLISRLPTGLKHLVCDVLACLLYWPLARSAWLLSRLGWLPGAWPLASYRHRSFYVMRTDALDRFGTRLEQRFSRAEIESMLLAAGFDTIRFSTRPPFWCASARKKTD